MQSNSKSFRFYYCRAAMGWDIWALSPAIAPGGDTPSLSTLSTGKKPQTGTVTIDYVPLKTSPVGRNLNQFRQRTIGWTILEII
ncbi:Hypothetical protein NTJ_00274 [Nesidiocoris tenuis]|uniref:Uncharacterized protein n=1 Tax=Nesidiocoris tenuis TaxID=355587 RepID=A0ABN7A888_9HEMI|nr:Hypothetical protein NTJ_00274 [Nesidiocoris tenuis]